MRILPFVVSALITLLLILLLNNKWGSVPPVARFLSPQQGFWQNAEAVDHDFTEDLQFESLKGSSDVYLDERLVPHIFAEHDEDAYFIQGYLHAKFRLWQMEFQTLAAAGRISEKMGNDPRYVAFDKEQRRSGMVWAAENALIEIEKDPETKASCDAYTAGINAYINTLTINNLPFEYKLLDYEPEAWSNLKIALFLKQMSKTLSGNDDDLENTATKNGFSFKELMYLNPQVPDSLQPIIPSGTLFATAGILPQKPADAESVYFNETDSLQLTQVSKPDPNNGSNNWVVAGSKTKTGAPILANDPHLELSFPSIWYEMQITTPNINAYGVSFPGSPNIIVGFNDSIAWGVTNSQRDVRDYYKVEFKDETQMMYRFNEQWVPTQLVVEEIKTKNGSSVFDTVPYTIFGPVMFDHRHSDKLKFYEGIALRWTAHDPSNEARTFYDLNRAKNYSDYENAIQSFTCPAQNFVFASKSGDIAIWQQGRFPARWYGQGTYIMPGSDSSYMWQGFIPQVENPHAINPEQGFLQSANQRPVDSAYPYFIPGNYIVPRGVSIHQKLSVMQQVTVEDMMKLQNDYHSVFAASVIPLLLKNVQEKDLEPDAQRYLAIIKQWDFNTVPGATAPTIYQSWFDSLESLIWTDEFNYASSELKFPDEQTLFEYLVSDSAFRYIDDINTTEIETLPLMITRALNKASKILKTKEEKGIMEWTKHKNPTIYHLLRTALMPFSQQVAVGGWSNVINATTTSHGPSWRMIVHLDHETEAYGVYPGGQHGNPGSRFYNSFVDTWAMGKYYTLFFMKKLDVGDDRIKWKMNFNPAV
ncbi:MAG: penicillin acylase family protein [Chitinophagaceae bacterium]|nr:penicillin acylase family protein [Chitinophagaceae bacterium]